MLGEELKQTYSSFETRNKIINEKLLKLENIIED